MRSISSGRAWVSTWIVTSSGMASVVDDLADEVEVGLARGREADLDLLVAHADEQLEHAPLAGGAHGVDQGLVAVAQVDRAPQRCLRDPRVRPGAVGQGYGLDQLVERLVAVDGHLRRALDVPGGLAVGDRAGGGASAADCGDGMTSRRAPLGVPDQDEDRRTRHHRDEGPVGQTPPRQRRSSRTTGPRVAPHPPPRARQGRVYVTRPWADLARWRAGAGSSLGDVGRVTGGGSDGPGR